MRDIVFNKLAIGADQAAQVDILVPDPRLAALSDQLLDKQHLRAFAQVVRAGLEAQSEHAYPLLAARQNRLGRPFNVLLIAGQNGLDQRQPAIQFLAEIRQRPDVLREAGSAEGETWI